MRRTHSHSPSPTPSLTRSPQQHAPPPPNALQGRENRERPEETGHGERDEQGEIATGGPFPQFGYATPPPSQPSGPTQLPRVNGYRPYIWWHQRRLNFF